ncbi:MAG: TetR/AcrR family transcriptional regulator [Aestuariivirga sp.]|uniref:TetR/AcrR family transcriptional regulator n=1 Tax=Aestuariivirga sp. TaxID=2650926 RepID=UPI0030183B55
MAHARKSRDPIATRARILAAAKVEFARKGLGGARVDDIAARAKVNKRMLYHYFGNKEDLFRITLEDAYAGIRLAEARLEIEKDDPVTALTRLIRFTWQYYLDNPEFITLVNSENLHKARHIKASERMREMSRPFVGRMRSLLERGVRARLFRPDLDAVQVNITIAAIGYYYLTNRFTGSIVFERDLMSKRALDERLDFNTKTILRVICTPRALAKMEAAT